MKELSDNPFSRVEGQNHGSITGPMNLEPQDSILQGQPSPLHLLMGMFLKTINYFKFLIL